MKRLLLAFAGVALVASVAIAQPFPGHMRGQMDKNRTEKQVQDLTKALDLTAKQQAEITKIYESLEKDESKLVNNMKEKRDKAEEKVLKTLNEDQKAKFAQYKHNCEKQMRAEGMDRRPPMKGEFDRPPMKDGDFKRPPMRDGEFEKRPPMRHGECKEGMKDCEKRFPAHECDKAKGECDKAKGECKEAKHECKEGKECEGENAMAKSHCLHNKNMADMPKHECKEGMKDCEKRFPKHECDKAKGECDKAKGECKEAKHECGKEKGEAHKCGDCRMECAKDANCPQCKKNDCDKEKPCVKCDKKECHKNQGMENRAEKLDKEGKMAKKKAMEQNFKEKSGNTQFTKKERPPVKK